MANPTIDFFPFGDGGFLIQLFRLETVPDHIGFGRYYHGTCEIRLADGRTNPLECVVYRPSNRRNVTGDRMTDWLCLWVKADFTEAQLSSASIAVVRYGAELSEQEFDAAKQEIALWNKGRHA